MTTVIARRITCLVTGWRAVWLTIRTSTILSTDHWDEVVFASAKKKFKYRKSIFHQSCAIANPIDEIELIDRSLDESWGDIVSEKKYEWCLSDVNVSCIRKGIDQLFITIVRYPLLKDERIECRITSQTRISSKDQIFNESDIVNVMSSRN